MQGKRLKSIERMLAIQSRIRKLAEWRQKAIELKTAAAREESRALVISLNGDGPASGLFPDMTARRLHRVAVSIWELDAAATEQARHVLTETGREKRTARLAEHVRKVKLRTDQDGALVEIMDALEGKRAANI
jgi:hypothetical protein